MSAIILLITAVFILPSHSNDSSEYRYKVKDTLFIYSLTNREDSTSELTFQQTLGSKTIHNSSWPLTYPVFQYQVCDVNGDGQRDICVGVIKKTRFDPIRRKRLFMFQILGGNIRPLWLGSRLGQPLEDFRICNNTERPTINTIEQERDGSFLVCIYKWRSFGLEFIDYIKRNISLNEARKTLNNL